jgi:hypothetical protein
MVLRNRGTLYQHEEDDDRQKGQIEGLVTG